MDCWKASSKVKPNDLNADRFPFRLGRGECGFTLLEVLVALTLVAVGLAALIRASGQTATNVGYIREKTIANWVAENRLAELRLQSEWPAVARSDGEAQMAGADWRWRVAVSETEDPDLRRIEISVAREPDRENPILTLVSFRGRRK